jgi:uncharacterized protein YbjQ (UPF0145 family)
MLIVTTNDAPGYEVEDTFGEVFGLVVRSRNVFSNIFAGLRSLFGGEIGSYSKLLALTRQQAIERLIQEAEAKGANAVLMMRFDSGSLAGAMNEVVAYGTAARVRRVAVLEDASIAEEVVLSAGV